MHFSRRYYHWKQLGLTVQLRNSIFRYIHKRIESTYLNSYINVDSGINHNRIKKQKEPKCLLGKQSVLYTYNRILNLENTLREKSRHQRTNIYILRFRTIHIITFHLLEPLPWTVTFWDLEIAAQGITVQCMQTRACGDGDVLEVDSGDVCTALWMFYTTKEHTKNDSSGKSCIVFHNLRILISSKICWS